MAITSRVTKLISSPMTKRNPRPRKYASQAERQAAYRARNVMLEFRAEPKTADNISKIADTLGYPRSDVLLSMVKFALTNHDWARFGLTHKTIPTYKENPTMKPASPAQLAARKRFAEMARSGAFKKATKRKTNPDLYSGIYAKAQKMASMAKDGTLKIGNDVYKFTFDNNEWVYKVTDQNGNYVVNINEKNLTKAKTFLKNYLNNPSKRKANPATIQYIVYSELSPQKYKQMLVTENKQRAISVADVNQMDGYHSVVEDQVGHLIYDAKTRKGYLQSNPSKRKANPADIHLAGNYYGKVSKDGTGSFWTYVVNRVKEVNPDGSLYETDDVVGDFKAKHYVTMKGAINALDKYKAKLSGVKRNPAKKTVSKKISQLVHEGYPQRQAVAVALSEQRAGKVKRNPAKVKYRNLATDLKGDQRVGYSVHLASQPGHNAIAWFSKKADAVKVAQEAADRTGKDLAVSRVQNYFGAM